jgi:hypothetical protein
MRTAPESSRPLQAVEKAVACTRGLEQRSKMRVTHGYTWQQVSAITLNVTPMENGGEFYSLQFYQCMHSVLASCVSFSLYMCALRMHNSCKSARSSLLVDGAERYAREQWRLTVYCIGFRVKTLKGDPRSRQDTRWPVFQCTTLFRDGVANEFLNIQKSSI